MTTPGEDAPAASPRADLLDALGWLVLGVAVLAASLAMDRLDSQDVPPFAAPGLLPGLLGVSLLLFGGVLLTRSLRRGTGRSLAVVPREVQRRAALVIALCMLFGVVLVGHGLPFWLAATVFVTGAILILQPGTAHQRRFGAKPILVATMVGLGAGGAVTLLFQQVFLVRLP